MKADLIYRIVIFLFLNFGALAIGAIFTGKGVPSDWYVNLNKAPWTPPGWVFGAAWSTIMVCFSIYMAYLWKMDIDMKLLITLYTVQWILNVSWNPVFFYFHQVTLGLVVIVSLTILVTFFLINYWSELGIKSAFILPYVLWLFIATSLNGYILFKN